MILLTTNSDLGDVVGQEGVTGRDVTLSAGMSLTEEAMPGFQAAPYGQLLGPKTMCGVHHGGKGQPGEGPQLIQEQ